MADQDDISFDNNSQIPSKIPDGDQYEVVFKRFHRHKLWGQDKLFLFFVLQTPGPWFGEEFYMVCKVAPNGKWRPSCKYWRNWVLANGKQPNRHDRLSTKVFRNKVFRARFRIVVMTSKPNIKRTADMQYSVIDELLGVNAGC